MQMFSGLNQTVLSQRTLAGANNTQVWVESARQKMTITPKWPARNAFTPFGFKWSHHYLCANWVSAGERGGWLVPGHSRNCRHCSGKQLTRPSDAEFENGII